MQTMSRMFGLGFLFICLAALGLKLVVAVPGPLGYAPLNLGLGPAAQPVEVVIWYGTEKQAWLEAAAQRFMDSGATLNGRPISITLVGIGSREIAERIARQDWGSDPPPTVASPASSLWTELLRSDWAALNNGAEIINGSDTPLVLTPLVAVVWEERAAVLWPRDPTDFWPSLHDALADPEGWIGVARANGFSPDAPEAQRAANWGLVKFGHTSPLRSNSGAQALLLMAYGYHEKTNQLSPADVLDPSFQTWLTEMESAVLDFGASTGTFMTNMVQFGPSKYDLVLVYENLAVEYLEAAEGRWGQPLRIVYPPATMFSDHPYAILADPLTNADQRAAAERFRTFLMERPQQELALSFGFRPADPAVPIVTSDPNNPFNRYTRYGLQLDIAQQVETPTPDTLTTLLDFWRRRIGPIATRYDGNP